MPRQPNSQRGAALIVFAMVLILGVAWFTVGALGKAAPTKASREIRTGEALQAGKQALLAYVAQYAARFDTAEPGQLPCPESLNLTSVGAASSSCSATAIVPGRLPWKTLGRDQLRDGDGEPLWYIMRGFRDAPINFGTAGQLTHNAGAVVAVIIAPGRPLDTLSDPGTPPAGCNKLNQGVAGRNTAPLNPDNFLECGVGTGIFTSPENSLWTNDRVIAITAAEWADAIAGPVADRVQRQVLPALADWNQVELTATGKSWSSPYLPFASSFSDPATNAYCGAATVGEGLAPLASKTSPGCDTTWTASPANVLGLSFLGCTSDANYVECQFQRFFGSAPFSARVIATAPKVAGSFRGPIVAADVAYIGTAPASTSFSLAISGVTGNATATVDVTWPVTLPSMSVVKVRIPHLPDAAVLSDSRVAWFRNNNWERYAYYAVAPSATAASTTPCLVLGDPGCVEVRGLPSSTGNYWDKRLVTVMAGMPLAGQSRSCATDVNANSIPDCNEIGQYFEEQNTSTADRVYRADLRVANPSAPSPPYPAFNDRVATCPFQYATDSGNVTVCN